MTSQYLRAYCQCTGGRNRQNGLRCAFLDEIGEGFGAVLRITSQHKVLVSAKQRILTVTEALVPKAKTSPVRITDFPPRNRQFSSQPNLEAASTLTAIVSNDEVDLRVELDFQEFMAHEVLEAGFARELYISYA